MSQISSYYATVGFKLDLASVRAVDRAMLRQQRQMQRHVAQLKKMTDVAIKGFVLPPLTVKKFKFDNIALQRGAQMSLNQVSRLLELPIKNFYIDQTKLNRQVQTSLQRAANQARIVTKTVTGNSGGYGVHNVGGHAQNTANSFHAAQRQAYSNSGVGMGLGIGSALSGYLGPAVLGYGAMRGYNAYYQGNADAVSNRHLITNVVADPQGTKADNSARGKEAFDYLYSESNRLGLDAKMQAEGYAKIIAAGQASGLNLEDSQKMFSQLSEHATVMHLDQQKQARLLLALGQILAKGQVYSEELKGQIGESSPTLPAYFAKAWAQKTNSGFQGAEAMGALMKAMERGQVKSDVALQALALASRDAQPSLALSTQTSAAELNRARNIRSYTMNEASIQGVEDGLFRVNRAIRVFSEDLSPYAEQAATAFGQYLGATADFTLGLRGLAKGIPSSKSETIEAAKEMPWWYFSQANPATLVGVSAYKAASYARDRFQHPDTTQEVQQLQRQDQLQRLSLLAPSSNNVAPVFQNTWNISTTAGNADELAEQLAPHMERVFSKQAEQLTGLALLSFPQTE